MDVHPNSQTTDFFSNMQEQDQIDLYNIGTERSFNKDDMVFQMGSSSADVFIILDGRVKVYELSQEGKEVILWFCFPGEIFGLAEVVRREFRKVNAQACSQVQVLAIGQAKFEEYLKQHPTVAMIVITLLSSRLRELGDVLLNIASDDVTMRVIKLITRLTARYGRFYGNNMCLDIPLTHQEMADMIGTSRQTVTKVLGSLKRKGILKIEQKSIIIQNYAWVETITGHKIDTTSHSTH